MVTKVTESLSFIVRVGARPTELVTGCDGVDGVEAKLAVKRDGSLGRPCCLRWHRHGANLVTSVTRERKRKLEGPWDGVSQAVTELVTERRARPQISSLYVTTRRTGGASDTIPRSLSGGSDRVGTGLLGVQTAVVTPAVTVSRSAATLE